MFTTIDELFATNDKDIVETATKFTQLQNDLNSGKITLDEFKELSEDLLDLKKIDDLSATIEHKAELKQAFDFLRILIKTV